MIQSPLKWVGGKSRITDFILKNAPTSFLNYHEPFVGSGAVFLAVKQAIGGSREWYLSDANPHLICWWRAVQSDIAGLLDELNGIQATYQTGDCKASYQQLRSEFNKYQPLNTRKAALFMFLCRTAFNGLVRYNSKGEFNSAWGNQLTGKHKDAFVIDRDHLLELNVVLQGDIFFECHSYESSNPQNGDFGFFDPPYVAVDDTRQIDALAYCKDGFDLEDQKKFAGWCQDKNSEGVHLMICNHDTPFIREQFPEFGFIPYDLMKHFSGVGSARKKTTETLILNYSKQEPQDEQE